MVLALADATRASDAATMDDMIDFQGWFGMDFHGWSGDACAVVSSQPSDAVSVCMAEPDDAASAVEPPEMRAMR